MPSKRSKLNHESVGLTRQWCRDRDLFVNLSRIALSILRRVEVMGMNRTLNRCTSCKLRQDCLVNHHCVLKMAGNGLLRCPCLAGNCN